MAHIKKRAIDTDEGLSVEPQTKSAKTVAEESWFSEVTHGKGRLIPKNVFRNFTADDFKLLEVKSSCTELSLICKAIKFRKLHRLCIRLPEDDDDSSYYIKDGLRKVYPYAYLYQTYAKRRWIGRNLLTILKQEFRDISDEQLKRRFDKQMIMVNGEPVTHEYRIKDNDFVSNRTHRHELPVLATPIKKIYEDNETIVFDKPPSVPIHPCGRYRHNTMIGILCKEYGYKDLKSVHRLDRLVSGVLIFARNTNRARKLEQMIQNRDVIKEYVCRVEGNFPDGDPTNDGFITVEQPLEVIPGKIGITVVLPSGKSSVTRFKKLNYNGKTSAVLCQPKTGRMHQIRVHLQYLGYPVVNDSLYNCDSFGPERGKGARYGKTLRQLSSDVIAAHRSNTWMIAEDNDLVDDQSATAKIETQHKSSAVKQPNQNMTARFLSPEEELQTLEALGHYFTDESWKDMELKSKYDPDKDIKEAECRDCHSLYLDPPLRRSYLYLHALRYSGTGWSYETEMPVWAREDWNH